MQIIDLYIRGGRKYIGTAYFPTQTRLVDVSADFTNGDYKVGQIIKELSTGTLGKITAIVSENTLDVSGGVFNGSKAPYQIYDDFTKLELFKDESVSITDSIQNVKDPEKIFAPFSQQFSVPASKNNNKFFKHYYDIDVNNSFDARYQGDGLIQLNGVNYKVGKIRLTSVELKNNVAYSYKLVFTGETVEFKEILAESELSSLQFPDSLNFDYTNDFVKSRFTGGNSYDILFPLITHSKNMRFNNGEYKDNITGTYLNYADLKPALKVKRIIDAIETTYPQLKFSQQFFNSFWFKQLYMWLHREEGYLSNSNEGGALRVLSNRYFQRDDTGNNYEYVSGTDLRPVRAYSAGGGYLNVRYSYIYTWRIFSTDPNRNYDVEILRSDNNATLFEESGTGDQLFSFEADVYNYGINLIDLTFNITSESTLGLSQTLSVQRIKRIGSSSQQIAVGFYEKPAPISETIVSINRQMPKMKIIDFLKNIFKMHNLTAYTEDGIINVLPLDDYYNAGVSYDITRYIDTKKSTVSKLLQFKNMIFDFKSKKSYLVQYAQELQGNKFSEESYGNDEWDGGDYKIEVDFEKMMFERLSDESDSRLTLVTQGAMLDKKFEPTIGQPLLLYIIPTSMPTSDTIKWDNSNNTFSNIFQYRRPANGFSAGAGTGGVYRTLNFGVEIDEYTLSSQGVFTSSDDLYTRYYRNYVENLFARNSRKTNVSAYLPLDIILKYRLNDVFIIGTTQYRINSIKTNLLTNKSDLELYNLNTNVEQQIGNQSPSLGSVTNLTLTNAAPTTLNFEWDSLLSIPNLVRYEGYLDDQLELTIGKNINTAGLINLEPDTNYKISIRAIYEIDGDEVSSFDTDLFAATTI
jgi:hypothetical protein